jgi:Tol biopolymer transport system component
MWSSDGHLLTFNTSGYLHQIDISTNQVRQITESPDAQYQGAVWINDEWIVTVGADRDARSLFRLTTDGGQQSRLIFSVLNSRYAVTTKGVAVVLAGETNAQALFGVDVQSGRRWSLSPTGFWFSSVLLSADEEWVYFASTFDGANSIYRTKIDGTGLQYLYALADDDRAVNLQLMPDHNWVMVSYIEDNFPIQRLHRVRINTEDGHVETLPDGATPMASSLIDMGWKYWRLLLLGGVLCLLSLAASPIIGTFKQRKN